MRYELAIAFRGLLWVVSWLTAVEYPVHAAARRSQVDCGCDAVGDYESPMVASIAWNATVSPGGTYRARVESGVGDNILLTVVGADEAPLFSETYPASLNWGFGPDEDRLALHFRGVGGKHEARRHDLGSDDPEEAIWEWSAAVAGSRSVFSPHGRYFL